jgi:hypothetical protein
MTTLTSVHACLSSFALLKYEEIRIERFEMIGLSAAVGMKYQQGSVLYLYNCVSMS